MQAALDMRSDIASFNERQPDKALILKISVHKGAAIAVTLNDRLDYFGQTVNIAARVQNLADADEIFVSQDVYEAKGVCDELAGYSVEFANSAASRHTAGGRLTAQLPRSQALLSSGRLRDQSENRANRKVSRG